MDQNNNNSPHDETSLSFIINAATITPKRKRGRPRKHHHDHHQHPASPEEAEKRRQVKNPTSGRKKTSIACIHCYKAKVR